MELISESSMSMTSGEIVVQSGELEMLGIYVPHLNSGCDVASTFNATRAVASVGKLYDNATGSHFSTSDVEFR